jgi:DNA-directed RNA polymerase subunit beta
MKQVKNPSTWIPSSLEVPNLLEIQLNSYRHFLEHGLPELLRSFSPIYDFTNGNYIEFLDFSLGEPKYPADECRDRDVTFEAPLKVAVRLGKRDGETIESEVYFGDLPIMTNKGTFIINGRERVIVSQLTRSPGMYFFDQPQQATRWELKHVLMPRLPLWCEILPNHGKWLEIGELEPNFQLWVTLNQNKRIPLTQLMKAFWAFKEARQPIQKPLKDSLHRRLAEPVVDPETGEVLADKEMLITEKLLRSLPKSLQEKAYHVYTPASTNTDLLLAFGKRKVLRNPRWEDLVGKRTTQTIQERGQTIIEAFGKIDEATARRLASSQLSRLEVLEVNPFIDATLEVDPTKDTRSALRDLHKKLRPGETPNEENAKQQLYVLLFDPRNYDLGRVGRRQINKRLNIDLPLTVRNLTVEDLAEMVWQITRLYEGEIEGDDIDHLRNKRIRSIGELLLNTMRAGMVRMEKAARERLTSQEDENLLPSVILSVKPVMASIKSFFSTSHLSTFMDQTNPLSEISNKRRLSTLPEKRPSSSSKAGVADAQREVQPSEYGRICPIETPEGPNVGLIKQLTLYSKVDEDGFIYAPFRVVKDGRVTDEIIYLVAGDEDDKKVAPPDTPVDADGRFLEPRVQVRYKGGFPEVPSDEVELVDASPVIFSVAASLIPFLNHDDGARALMGANMQRQAVPLLRSEKPYVATGYEPHVAVDSGSAVFAQHAGTVERVTATEITIRREDGEVDTYPLIHGMQSNKSTCFTQRPIVRPGQRVLQGQPIADGPTCQEGQLALGKNLIVAYMPWRGYNYEDAILVSERLVKEDVYTSIHIERHETEAVDTKLGPEEITRDIPNVPEEILKNLDENGIIRVGAEVHPLDYLVGKIAPKGQQELSSEEKLIIAIFGQKGEEGRDVSLKLPHGEQGTVVSVKTFSRFKYRCKETGRIFYESKRRERMVSEVTGGELEQLPGDELPVGTNMTVQVHVAQKRKLMVGDKMAGRHGNKGVISKIVPEEDMPFLMDGTPVDIVLNPLGVPSRLNDGQLLEAMLGLVGKKLDIQYICPAFQGLSPEEVMREVKRVAEMTRQEVLQAYVNSELKLNIKFRPGTPVPEMLEEVEKALRKLGKTRLEEISQIVAGEPVISVTQMDPRASSSVEDNEPPYEAPDEVYRSILDRIKKNVWVRTGIDEETGKSLLRDGYTGDVFQHPVFVGVMYMFKLEHLAEDKIHARSIGPYSLVTQQPLGGKAQFGGQRFGEMEVWALEAYGAAHTLQEILTIKSDDVMGRVKTYEGLVRGEPMLEPGIPEAFKILMNELRSLCLNVVAEDEHGKEINLKDLDDGLSAEDLKIARSIGYFW